MHLDFLVFTINKLSIKNQLFLLSISNIQWRSEIWPFEIRKHLKSWLFEGWISNGPVFKWMGFSYGYSPNHSKTGPFKIRTILSGFKMFLRKWHLFVWISNGWVSGFQIPFKIWTICNPTSFWPFKIQTSPDFRSPLYNNLNTGLVHFLVGTTASGWARNEIVEAKLFFWIYRL